MKKLINIVILGISAMMLFGCAPSEIKASQEVSIPAGAVIETGTRETWTMPETSKYTIPADAETGEALSVTDRLLAVPVPGYHAKLLHLKPVK